ncbi:hypothetical protein G9A89_016084 [Geosiphon pyriformis]|nr:hypothetical protein G9A89_016084 [Geosiphon pyriformis]
MAYTSIAKLEKFTGNKNNAQTWINNIAKAIVANNWNNTRTLQAIPYFLQNTTDAWCQSLVTPPQTFQQFKTELLRYFSNNNSINRLVNTFNTIKQGDTEAITTYLGRFHKNLPIQKTTIVPKIKCISQHQPISSGSQRCASVTTVVNKGTSEQTAMLITIHNREINIETPIANFKLQDINKIKNNINPLICHISNPNLSTTATSNISTTATNHLSTPTNSNTAPESSSNNIRQPSIQIPSSLNPQSELCPQNLNTGHAQNPNSQHYLSLLVTPEDAIFNKPESNQQLLTNMIPPATISNDKSLAVIFPFKLKETTPVLLFSRAALEKKPITAIYTDARVDGHPIKLILDSESANSIITRQLIDQLGSDGTTKTPIGEIDDFSFKVNGIMTFIKVLVMKATQYQALVGNDWLFKGQHICVLVTCGHFKTPSREKLLIELKELTKSSGPTLTTTNYHPYYHEMTKEKEKRKKNLPGEQIRDLGVITAKEQEEEPAQFTTPTYVPYSTQSQATYHQLKLECITCGKKLSTIDNILCLACGETLLDKRMWNDIPRQEEMCDKTCPYTILINNWIWRMAYAMAEKATASELWEIKPIHYPSQSQNITHKRRTKRVCDLIYNPPICIIYTIPEGEEPISSCTLELGSPFNFDSNSNNDNDKNTGSSSVQYGNNNNTDSNSDSNSDTKYEQYITIPDLTRELELK